MIPRRPSLVIAAALVAAACGHPTDANENQDVAGDAGEEETRPVATPFVERFETLDDGFWLVSDGWSNGDWMGNDFLRSQIATGPDGLTVTLDRVEGREKSYASGEIRTIGRYDHGYFEARMQPPRGSGLVTGFFTYTGVFFGDPHDEVDVEILGRNTREVSFTYFANGAQTTEVVPLGFDAADALHVYGFEWTPEVIRWYVDGELAHEVLAADGPLPVTPQILYLDLWNSETLTDWVGPVDPRGAPWTLRVACIAYAESYPGEPICAER